MTEPTADDINRLEKAAWDANVDQVLVWERVQSERMERQFTALRRALAALIDENMEQQTAHPWCRVCGGVDGHATLLYLCPIGKLAAILAEHPAP